MLLPAFHCTHRQFSPPHYNLSHWEKCEKTALEGFLPALRKPALPSNPLLCEDSAHRWGLSGEVAQWQGGGLNQSRGEPPSPLHPVCRRCSFPRSRAQEAQRSAPCTLPWPGVVFLCRSRGHGGQNCAVEGAVRVEISLPLIHRVVGEDSYPARKETTSKQLEHPISTQQIFITHLARVRPARPFPSVLQSNVHTGSATMKQRRKLRSKEVARLDTDQA